VWKTHKSSGTFPDYPKELSIASQANPTTRKRTETFTFPPARSFYSRYFLSLGTTRFYRNDGPSVSKEGTQVTVSSGHPFRSRSKGNVEDLGGDFYTTRQYITTPREGGLINFSDVPGGNIAGDPIRWSYKGPLLSRNPATQGFPDNIASSNAALDTKGATAIARCKPTNSAANLGVFLGELKKDGLPSLIGSRTWKSRTLSSKNAGDEYLNIQFGWKPLANDVKKFVRAVGKAHKLIQQYERDAGRVVRRKYEFPIEYSRTETKTLNRSPWMASYPDSMFSDSWYTGTLVTTTETWRRTWFSGAFTYFLPTGYDSRKELDRLALLANEISGLDLSPSLLWELAPWSWAVDWFGNIGDVLSNVSDAADQGLVMRYGYIMEHSINKVTYRWVGAPPLKGVPDTPSPLTYVTETKQRRGANPFGFGLSWSGLSPYQLSIAAALGLSRR